MKVLLIAGGGFHDYEVLAPYLTHQISRLIRADFDIRFGLEILGRADFAAPYDAVIYDICDERAPDTFVENALTATRKGKATVMIHCSLHAFRYSPKLAEWETCCGLRTKSHEAYRPFKMTRVDAKHPITRSFPEEWTTPGDELYQMISIDPQSTPLLSAKSPKDGRDHVVAWTYRHGEGRVFATTLGHDLKTTSAPEFLRLVAHGLLWSCAKLTPEGAPAAGYSAEGN